MFKCLKSCLALLLILTAFSCKKDMLYWEKVQQLNSGTSSNLYRIKFIDQNICVVAGGLQFTQALALRSVDGGYTFSQNSYPAAGKAIFGMCAQPAGNIYTCGTDGTILHSTDSGKTFNFSRILTWLVYYGASFPKPDTGIFISSILQRQSSITRVDSNTNIIDNQTFLFGLNNIYMVDGSEGYVVGYGAVMKTNNCGASWNYQSPTSDDFTAMDIHGDEIWMCGSNGSIFHTTNGGSSWQRQRNGNDFTQVHYGLRCITFKDENNGWAAGDDGKIIYSSDGGNHWSEYNQFTTNTIRSIAVCPNGDLLTAGDNGILFRLTTN